jgi:hypothetical protein
LGVNGRRGQRRGDAQCDSGKRRKSGQPNPDQALQKQLRAFRLNTILAHVFSLVSTRSWIALPMRRLAAGKSYSGVFGFRLRRIGTIA